MLYFHGITVFQSTPPARGATSGARSAITSIGISIHAPREGGDANTEKRERAVVDISIHAPREGGDFTISANIAGRR